ncbi:MAG: hypothetical protein QOK48_1084 [Blastocatellia bacterium]|nr:hypothetical protein [Blastocatellia bacterium]
MMLIARSLRPGQTETIATDHGHDRLSLSSHYDGFCHFDSDGFCRIRSILR